MQDNISGAVTDESPADAVSEQNANVLVSDALDDTAALTAARDMWRARAEEAEAKLREREFNDALTRGLENVCFSSEAARRDITARIRAAGLSVSDGKLVGLDELLERERRADAAAFRTVGRVRFTDDMGAVRDVGAAGQAAEADAKSRIMAIKDRAERRAAIAANMDLFKK